MTQVLDWHKAQDVSTVIQSAVQALSEGKLVAFPTETVYGLAVSGLIPDAVKRLRQGKGRPADKPLALAIRGAWEVVDWVPDLSPLGRRLARHCWPGPVTLVFSIDLTKGRAGWLPESVQQQICPVGTIGFRVPDHDAIQMALDRLRSPLVLSSANRSGQPPATRAEEVVEAVGDEVALVIDDGPSRFGVPSTVVQVNGDSWEVLREGAVSSADIEKQTGHVILFVCTGNTCRSPMAEGLCKKLLAERLACRPEELAGRGFLVLSAGLTAFPGGKAAPEAIEVGREFGVDLNGHLSQLLTPELVALADQTFVMTRGHERALTAQFPNLDSQPRLLSLSGEDIADPLGYDLQVYRACGQEILNQLERLLPELMA